MHHVHRLRTNPAPGTARERVVLDYDARQKCRLLVRLEGGAEVGVTLPRGTLLAHGDCLEADDGTLIEVHAADEELSVATTSDQLLLARVAYHLGNRHVPLQIEPGRLSYRHDHVLDDLARRLGATVHFENGPFNPERGAYGHAAPAHSHPHDHDDHRHHGDHAHDHHHEPHGHEHDREHESHHHARRT